MNNKFTAFDWFAMVILLIGGVNWGLVGFFGFDLVAAIFGAMSVFSRIIYALVGLSAIYMAVISPALRHQHHAPPMGHAPTGAH